MSASYRRENSASILVKAVLTILRTGRRGCEAGDPVFELADGERRAWGSGSSDVGGTGVWEALDLLAICLLSRLPTAFY